MVMNSIFVSPESITPRSLNVVGDGETIVGAVPAILLAVGVSVAVSVVISIVIA